jgi:ComF family protein
MAVFHYSGVAGEAVRRLKYLRITSLAKPMANFVSLKYFAELEGLYDAVIPVPIHWSRRFQRGFNQAELLCEELPKGLVQPTWLKRTRATKPQVRLTPDQRLSSLIGAFRARRIVAGTSLLLVDDVVTSGGTYRACKAALLEQGAARVDLLAFAGSGRLKFD